MTSRGVLRPSAVLATYVESMVEGRRVVIFGDATSGLAELLEERGARIVHVYDPDPGRVAEATARNDSRAISFAALPPSGLAARDGAFELGIVDDLNGAGPAHSIVGRMRRALAPRGVALVAIPNPGVRERLMPVSLPSEGPLDYYELYDTLKSEFSYVRMLGQAPFVGYAVVDFAAGNPDPSIDTTLVPGGAEEPEWFVGLASDSVMSLDEFAVVQLPLAEVMPSGSGHARPDARSERVVARLQAETERLRRELTAATDDSEVERLRRQSAEQERFIRDLEHRLTVADERADEALEELEALQNKSFDDSEGQDRTGDLEAELEDLREGLRAAEKTAKSSADAARQATERLETAERQAEHERAARSEIEADLSRMESQLAERGAEVRRLQRDLTTLERLGRELLLDLEERGEAGPETSALASQLDALAKANARGEADLEAARWTIQALEGQLAGGGALEAELQEARAELSRQATLIAQLRAHGSA
ncbi:MAG: hypothetical protein R3B13_40000 [Polyangiaceae bacterium]